MLIVFVSKTLPNEKVGKVEGHTQGSQFNGN